MFVALWEFQVKPGLEKVFEEAYGPEGGWAGLFRQSPGYHGTRVTADPSVAGRYFTLDFWSSHAAYDEFRKLNAAAYAEMDRECEKLTVTEKHVGDFEMGDGRQTFSRAPGDKSR